MPVEEQILPSEVRSRLREYLDHNLAERLQNDEYSIHYDMNRSERRLVGTDVKISKNQQQLEDDFAARQRRYANQSLVESDEEVARRIAAEYAEEDRRAHQAAQEQLRIDEELAKRLASTGELATRTPPSTPSEACLIDVTTGVPSLAPSFPIYQAHQPSQSDWNNPQYQDEMNVSNQIHARRPIGIPLPGLNNAGVRSRSGTVDSQDEQWPTPPPIVLNPTYPQPIQPTQSSDPSTSSNLSAFSDIPWPTAVPLSANNPFYNDVVQAMSKLSTAPSSSSNSSSSSLPISTNQPIPPPTPSNSLIEQPPVLGPVITDTGPNYTDHLSQGNNEFGLPPPSALALGLIGIPNRPKQS